MPKKKATKKTTKKSKKTKTTSKKRVVKYKAAKGTRFTNQEAQVIGTRLDYIGKSHSGELTKDIVLDDARIISSPLHKYFDWDDTTAAEKYRRHQAGKIIQAVTVEVKIEGSREPMRGYLHVKNEKKKHVFVPHAVFIKTPSYVKQLVNEAREKNDELQRVLWLLQSHLK